MHLHDNTDFVESQSIASISQATPGVTPWETYGRGPAGELGTPDGDNYSLPASPKTQSPLAKEIEALNKCGSLASLADCESEQHHFAKIIYCGREYCPRCGEDGSATHKHRQSRWIPKVQQVESLAYFTIEFPVRERINKDICYSKVGLVETTNKIVDVLAGKRKGRRGRVGGFFTRGLVRWHWFGDYAGLINGAVAGMETLMSNAKRKPQRYLYAQAFTELIGAVSKMGIVDMVIGIKKRTIFISNRWGQHADVIDRLVTDFAKRYSFHIEPYSNIRINQHANILVDGGFISAEKLEEIKEALREAAGVPDLIVHYEYTDKPGKMVHMVRYITRSTFRDSAWNSYMANELFNFRNMRWWGDWKQEKVWEVKDHDDGAMGDIQTIIQLSEGICPICGMSLKVLYHAPEYCWKIVDKHDEHGDVVKGYFGKILQERVRHRRNPRAGKPVYWSKPVDSMFLHIWGAEEIGNTGYFTIPAREYDGEMLSPSKVVKGTHQILGDSGQSCL